MAALKASDLAVWHRWYQQFSCASLSGVAPPLPHPPDTHHFLKVGGTQMSSAGFLTSVPKTQGRM